MQWLTKIVRNVFFLLIELQLKLSELPYYIDIFKVVYDIYVTGHNGEARALAKRGRH